MRMATVASVLLTSTSTPGGEEWVAVAVRVVGVWGEALTNVACAAEQQRDELLRMRKERNGGGGGGGKRVTAGCERE